MPIAKGARAPRMLTSTPQSVEPATRTASGCSAEQRERLGEVGRPGEGAASARRAGSRRGRRRRGGQPRGIRVVVGRLRRGRRRRRGSAGSRCSGTGCRDRACRSKPLGPCSWSGAPVAGRPWPVGSWPFCDGSGVAGPWRRGRRGSTRPPCCRRSPACSSRTATRRAPPSRAAPGAGRRGVPRPSEVTTSWPSRAAAGTRQALIAVHWVPRSLGRAGRPGSSRRRTPPRRSPPWRRSGRGRAASRAPWCWVGTPESARGSPLTVIRGSVISLPHVELRGRHRAHGWEWSVAAGCPCRTATPRPPLYVNQVTGSIPQLPR